MSPNPEADANHDSLKACHQDGVLSEQIVGNNLTEKIGKFLQNGFTKALAISAAL